MKDVSVDASRDAAKTTADTVESIQATAIDAALETSAAVKPIRIRNWSLIIAAALIAVIGAAVFRLRFPSLQAWGGLLVCFTCLWSILIEVVGVWIGPESIRSPKRPLRWMPMIAWGRASINFSEVESITVDYKWLCFQRLFIESDAGRFGFLFQDRRTRVRFVEAVKNRLPSLKLYRF